MRRLLPLLTLALGLAAPAGAQQAGRYAIPEPGAALESRALRGALAAGLDETPSDAPARLRDVLAPALPPPLPQTSAPNVPRYAPPLSFGSDASSGGQCRLSCARTYYFCLANNGDDTCAQDWGQCRARCPSDG